MEKFQTDTHLNMPDLLFSRFCEEEYKVNRGVYNTIEQWLYNQGVHNIIQRREVILSFFLFIRTSQNSDGKIKFGHGGLTERLNKFWCQYKVAH
jgi:riboflavin kinase